MIDGINTRNAKINLEIDSRHAKYKGLVITQAQIGHNIRGSVHKYHNNGGNNATDFYLSNFEETLNRLFDDIGLNPDISVLNAFEFGVNIKLPITPERAINRLILHKSNIGECKKGYREFKYKEYILKIYKKTGIEHIRDNMLRVEIRVEKMRYIRDKKGVYVKTLSDLLDAQVWERLETVLVKSIEECLIIDLTDKEVDSLPDKLQKDYGLFTNPRHWEHLHNISRDKFRYEMKRCKNMMDKYSTSTLKQDITRLIKSKCSELRNTPGDHVFNRKWDKFAGVDSSENSHKITNLQNEFKHNFSHEITNLQANQKNDFSHEITIKIKCDFAETISENTDYTQEHENDSKSGVGNGAKLEIQNVKTCLTCGRVIIHPKKGQKYCSAKEVGYKAAHKCRNTASNPRNNTRRSIERIISIPMLFDLSETIDPDKRKYI